MICRNSEYYADPTAGKAIANVMREQEEANGKIRTWTWDRLDMENWADLGIAIVVRAAEEYRGARKRLAHRQNPKGAEARSSSSTLPTSIISSANRWVTSGMNSLQKTVEKSFACMPISKKTSVARFFETMNSNTANIPLCSRFSAVILLLKKG